MICDVLLYIGSSLYRGQVVCEVLLYIEKIMTLRFFYMRGFYTSSLYGNMTLRFFYIEVLLYRGQVMHDVLPTWRIYSVYIERFKFIQ